MGGNWSAPSPRETDANEDLREELGDRLTITGLGSQFPELLVNADELREWAAAIYPSDAPWYVVSAMS